MKAARQAQSQLLGTVHLLRSHHAVLLKSSQNVSVETAKLKLRYIGDPFASFGYNIPSPTD